MYAEVGLLVIVLFVIGAVYEKGKKEGANIVRQQIIDVLNAYDKDEEQGFPRGYSGKGLYALIQNLIL